MKVNGLACLLLSMLTGCILAPGMKMSEPSSVPGVKIVPITADLIQAQRVKIANEKGPVRDFVPVVQPGDTPREIARVATGDRRNWKAIAAHNDISNSTNIQVGQNTLIPAHASPAAVNGASAATAPTTVKVAANTTPVYRYRIGPHDVLNITVWDHPELTIPAGEFRPAEVEGQVVAEDGSIFYPFVGTVKVAGKTGSEIRRMLTEALSRHIVDPQLDVRVAAYRSQKAFIVGQVNNPGPQPITDVPLTVVDAIDQAGDVTLEADKTNVMLNRDGTVHRIDLLSIYEGGDMSRNYMLRDGDVLHVPDLSAQKVFIIGEVRRPTPVPIRDGRLSLTEALGEAGGVDQVTSNPELIYVIRGNPNESVIFHLDSQSPDALILADQFPMQARDVVFVGTAGVTRWSRVISQILPSAQFVSGVAVPVTTD